MCVTFLTFFYVFVSLGAFTKQEPAEGWDERVK